MIVGPTLLDLTELFDTSLNLISYVFMVGAFGSLIGSFFGGIIMDRYLKYRYYFMGFFVILFGSMTLVKPFSGSVYVFWVVALLGGLGTGNIDLGKAG